MRNSKIANTKHGDRSFADGEGTTVGKGGRKGERRVRRREGGREKKA